MANDLKLKGPVREIGVVRDSDRHDSFNITIGIAIKTEGKVSYEEAERLSAKFRREYLGKDVEFVSVSLPCPVCGKIMNSESGLRKHVAMNHPDKVDLVNPPKITAKEGKLEKKMRGKKAEKPTNAKSTPKKKIVKTVKTVNAGRTAKAVKPKKSKPAVRVEESTGTPSRVKAEQKSAPIPRSPKPVSAKQHSRGRQLTLA